MEDREPGKATAKKGPFANSRSHSGNATEGKVQRAVSKVAGIRK